MVDERKVLLNAGDPPLHRSGDGSFYGRIPPVEIRTKCERWWDDSSVVGQYCSTWNIEQRRSDTIHYMVVLEQWGRPLSFKY